MVGLDGSFNASTEQFGLGSWHPGVGPGQFLKSLVFNACEAVILKTLEVMVSSYNLAFCFGSLGQINNLL